MKTTFRLLAIASVLVAFGWVPVKAQSLAQFVFPANNATGVPVGDSIIITTHWKIDTSCLVPSDGDTIWGDTLEDDTEITNVFIISQFVHDSVSDSLWGPMSAAVQCVLLNDTTLSVHVGGLSTGTQYIAQINALRVIDTYGDTLTVPDTIKIHFRTAYGTQEIVGSSVVDSGGIMRCGDTIRVHFNQPLDSANTPSGPLFTISALHPTDTFPSGPMDTTVHGMYRDSGISSNQWLDPSDSTTVLITSSGLNPGQIYHFQQWPSRLTGDSIQNLDYTLNIKSKESIQLSTSGISSDSTYTNHKLFSPGLYSIPHGDTGFWVAPAQPDSFQFTHWSCPGVPGIDGSINDTLRLTPSCSNLQDLNIAANYILLPIDTLKVDSIPNGDSVVVLSLNNSVLANYGGTISGASTHSLPTRGGTELVLYAKPGTGNQFDHWDSNNGLINGNSSPYVPVKLITGNVWVTPIYIGILFGFDYNIGGEVLSADPGLTLTSCGCLVQITSPPAGTNEIIWSMPLDATPLSKPVTLSIPTYYYYPGTVYMPTGNYQDIGLWQTKVWDYGNEISSVPSNPTAVQNVGTSVTNSEVEDVEYEKYVEYDVKRFPVFVDIQIAMTDSATPIVGAPPSDLGLVLGNPTNQTGNIVVFCAATDLYNSNAPENTSGESDHSWDGVTYLHTDHFLTYEAGTNIHMQADAGGDYSFVGWIVYTSTNNGASWSTNSASADWSTEIHGADGSGHGTVILAKAVFQKNFILRSIAVDQDINYVGSPTNNVYSADQFQAGLLNGTVWSADEREMLLDGNNSVLYHDTLPTLRLVFTFSDAIDPTTLFTNLICAEQQNGLPDAGYGDLGISQPAFTFFIGSADTNYKLSNGDSTLTWDVSAQGGWEFTFYPQFGINPFGAGAQLAPSKLEKYLITLTSGLKSVHGISLANPNSYTGETVNPDVTWTVTNTAVNDFDNSSYYFLLKKAHLVPGGSYHTAHTYIATSGSYEGLTDASSLVTQLPSAGKSSVVDIFTGYSHDFNTQILAFTRPRNNSAIMGSVTTMNKQNGGIESVLNASLSVILNIAGGIAGSELANLILQPSTKADTATAENSAISKLTSGILNSADGHWTFGGGGSDEEMGSSAWTGNKLNWWGALGQLSKNSPGQNTYPDNMGNTTNTITVKLH